MCNCNDHIPLYNPCNVCNTNPCPPKEDCDCPIKDLSTDCVLYMGEDLECSNVKSGTPLTEVIEQLDEFICTKFEETNGALNLISVGDGEKIYKGIDGRGRREIKSLKGDDYITVTDNETTLDLTLDVDAITDSIPETFLENIGGGLEIYKEKTNSTFLLRTIEEESLGNGEELLNLEQLEDTIKVTHSKLRSDDLIITRDEDGSIVINQSQEDPGAKMFYVNESYTGVVQDGTINRPFRRLTTALREVIGTGDLVTPQYTGATVILQTNVTVTQDDLDNTPILENKITVNAVTITSDISKKTISFQGNDDYPISSRFIFNKIPLVNNSLTKSIYIAIININLETITHGIVDAYIHKNTSSNETTYVVTTDSDFSCKKETMDYDFVRTSSGSLVYQYGQPVRTQTSIPITTPHFNIEGHPSNNGTSITLNNTTITGRSQIHLNITDAVVECINTNVNSDSYFRNSDSLSGDIINPKSDLCQVCIDNSQIVGTINDLTDTPSTVNSRVGGSNSLFEFKRTNINSDHNFFNVSSFVFSSTYNSILTISNNVNDVYLRNSDLSNATTVVSAFSAIGTLPTIKEISINNSNINNIKPLSYNNIRAVATTATVNGYEFSTSPTFADDSEAISAGLIPGNSYFVTGTNIIKRIS